MFDHLKPFLKTLPSKPGVYQMFDAEGVRIYVGKAKNLKNRVSSYFQPGASHSERIFQMVRLVDHIEVIITQSDLEALILEANMIKTYRPKYNILMRDDKKYPWLMLTKEPFPRLIVVRQPGADSGRYFGPYASPGALYQTLQLIKKIFPLRKRRTPLFKDRPCMNYHIGSCLGPCQSLVSAEEYDAIVRQLTMFLRGDAGDLLASLETQMIASSEAMDFETAARLRDRMEAIEQVMLQQRVMFDDPRVNQDVIAIAEAEPMATIALLQVRSGKLINTRYFEVDLTGGVPVQEAYQAFLTQYYPAHPQEIPEELVLQYPVDDDKTFSAWLAQLKGKVVKLYWPKGKSRNLESLRLAEQNAQEAAERARLEAQNRLKNDPAEALVLLQERLKLPRVPRRMECYDISHVSGTHTVASMVVMTDGVPDKKEYRRFQIRWTEEGVPNDFLSMAEVMTRRFKHRGDAHWPEPDLVIIDGGKGQLSSAVEALEKLGVTDLPMCSLAKKFEEVYLPGQSRPVVIERDSKALFLLQQLRDEAHRFAITYHRKLRSKGQVSSWLDDISGIGAKRKQQLLKAFTNIEALAAASVPDIGRATDTTGKTAEKLYDAIQQALKAKNL